MSKHCIGCMIDKEALIHLINMNMLRVDAIRYLCVEHWVWFKAYRDRGDIP